MAFGQRPPGLVAEDSEGLPVTWLHSLHLGPPPASSCQTPTPRLGPAGLAPSLEAEGERGLPQPEGESSFSRLFSLFPGQSWETDSLCLHHPGSRPQVGGSERFSDLPKGTQPTGAERLRDSLVIYLATSCQQVLGTGVSWGPPVLLSPEPGLLGQGRGNLMRG